MSVLYILRIFKPALTLDCFPISTVTNIIASPRWEISMGSCVEGTVGNRPKLNKLRSVIGQGNPSLSTNQIQTELTTTCLSAFSRVLGSPSVITLSSHCFLELLNGVLLGCGNLG